jgi:cobalt-precorrin-5B (C1)-methyltransferase
MRNGFSTSACAAAASVAALRSLESGEPVDRVIIDLPVMKQVTFDITRYEKYPPGVCCGVIKDAGDDPDVTNGLEIQAVVRRIQGKDLVLLGGVGVGRVTLPGLSVPVGEAAINPGPRKLIRKIFREELRNLNIEPETGFEITIQVPDGERIAQQTMNPTLGIVGGISILGTDGLVRPYSAPAFRASIFYELRVARENGFSFIGLATGKRSRDYLINLLKLKDKLGVLDVGDELGYPIDQAVKMGFTGIHIGGMIGKLSKLAQGRFQTHVHEGEVDFDFLARLAAESGASADMIDEIRQSRTAHQVQYRLRDEGIAFEPLIVRMAAREVFERCGGHLHSAVSLFSLKGELLVADSLEAHQDD